MSDPRRRIPAVDRLLASEPFVELARRYPRDRVLAHLRDHLDAMRREPADASPPEADDPSVYARRVEEGLVREDVPSLRRVINATGVVLHTNLGRAPLAEEAIEAMERAARGYSNLEYDLEAGARGSRYDHCTGLLRDLTGAEDALVVNNNAAALVLALNTAADEASVLVSRGELVEIGGGFRIPEIVARAGARLREVGSTNRTRLEDYGEALDQGGAAAVLKVHRSNFRMTGFTEDASLQDLVRLGEEHGIPVIHDLGSGLLVDPASLGLPAEPTPRESVRTGAHLVAFSGDKLLGGPQAGILVGHREWIRRLRGNPLCRALRVDKVTLAGLEATLRLYRDPALAVRRIPALRALAADPEELLRRAGAFAAAARERGLPALDPDDGGDAPGGAVGGGTYPGVELPPAPVRVAVADAEGVARRLRSGDPPVVARIVDGVLLLDLRAVAAEEEKALLERLEEAAGA